MTDETEGQTTRKRSYSELKIRGPPLYNQGSFSEDVQELYVSKPVSLPLDASRTALLIVDVQPEYWSECPAVRKDFPHFPSQISSLVKNCRSQSAKCIWVRAEYSFERSPWLQQFSRLHQGRIPPIVKPSSEWEEFAEPLEGEFVMTKSSWSSTSHTRLLDVLKESGIDTVLVCGLITSVCVQHSAFGIFEAGFRTILVTDACADRGKPRHDAALALYGDYMYELQTVASVEQEFQQNSVQVSKTVLESITKPCDKSRSSGSLSTLDTTTSSDEEEEEEIGHEEELTDYEITLRV
jgi:nicotinamidase-related amidase